MEEFEAKSVNGIGVTMNGFSVKVVELNGVEEKVLEVNGLNSVDTNDEADGLAWEQFYGAKTWGYLEAAKVRAARKEEIEFMKKTDM